MFPAKSSHNQFVSKPFPGPTPNQPLKATMYGNIAVVNIVNLLEVIAEVPRIRPQVIAWAPKHCIRRLFTRFTAAYSGSNPIAITEAGERRALVKGEGH
jgi:hypothetical protein